uniref:Uncharacterized protein n=1 Tax=Dunaliella tertiolecta TaxID=3047 RepID=A0A7S3QL58_DUNTE
MKHTQLKTQHSTGLATKPHHRVLAVCKHSSIRYACQVSCQCDRKDALGNLSHASTSADPDRWPNSHGVDRRSALAMGAALLGGPTRALCGLPAQANEAPTPPNQKLPKAYVEVVQRVIKSLRESIEAEQKDGKETEVRRKADPAKEALQVFVKRWRDDPKVQQHPSHESIKGVLLELSSFYQTAGPRARMPADVQVRYRKKEKKTCAKDLQ